MARDFRGEVLGETQKQLGPFGRVFLGGGSNPPFSLGRKVLEDQPERLPRVGGNLVRRSPLAPALPNPW